ncbi:MAG TPA: zinc ribbon domain-containing protein [Pyrinomonadaceae bacterium]|nr:zinc ribbon domain-containing protein [Pyrinomonadaceae bacterium]
MPIFEYVCRECDHRFEKIVYGDAKPACPECRSRKIDKQLSVFAAATRGEGAAPADFGPAPCGSCGDPRGPGSCSMN